MSSPDMSSPAPTSPPATPAPTSLLQYPSFVWLWFTRTATTAAFHMQGVAVGWQLYEMTGSPIDLGIVGFIQFLPLVVLNLVVGQVTDRYDRRAIIRSCQIVKVAMVGAACARHRDGLADARVDVRFSVGGFALRARSRCRACRH